ncbi:MAG: UDP-N-acetylglucosamine 1-carboxyvinyltransferase [Roseburia sp.]|nr:UDP-N-acetylglucosamine 1-carboxyvinyltransferase [Roseburia sp.]MCM1278504.1 UDP-N-acetylglucosamine 1-carboxyvinyltransferase [Robinsoniella sp.]
MKSIDITGGNTLCGEVSIQGSKNAALPLLAASVLIKGVSVIHNCPRITDIFSMIKILESIGCKVRFTGHSLEIDAKDINSTALPEEYVKVMRSSIIFIGAMLAREKEVSIHYPGGCVIGNRPIDMHLGALEKLGVEFSEEGENIRASARKLAGSEIVLPFPSVGATQNVILASVLAEGITIIKGAAKEPEVTEVCRFLQNAGARIHGIGTETLEIEGVKSLEETEFTVVPDRIVAGTYLLAGAATRGAVLLENAPVEQMDSLFLMLRNMGAKIHIEKDHVFLNGEEADKSIPFMETRVYPGFPTDLQSPLMAVLSKADGISVIRETIFENRFRVAKELNRMGARIFLKENQALIYGVEKLKGMEVAAEELRGGAALIIAGLLAEGRTKVAGLSYIERGYEDIVRDFKCLGAKIEKS